MKKLFYTILPVLLLGYAMSACGSDPAPEKTLKPTVITEANTAIAIPIAGNSYVTAGTSTSIPGNDPNTGFILNDQSTVVSVYFKVTRSGELLLGMMASAVTAGNQGVVKVTALGQSFNISLDSDTQKFYPIGNFTVTSPGYIKVDFQGVSKTADKFANITKLRIGGTASTGSNTFITESQVAQWYYWGRRGPSVHLRYQIGANIEYFYNEFTVTAGNDVIGSYFMTNGFKQGYFGFQVNSATERRILFSVWSPFETDKPSEIPADMQVINARAGSGVHIGTFGNEGSGGQSYLQFMWKAGVTYRTLVQVKEHSNIPTSTCPYITEYTGYFYDPEQSKWILIASWKRPDISYKTYTDASSFLENFDENRGWITREGHFGNQWTRNISGTWAEVTQASFTYDATASAGVRLDYYGGLSGNKFMLRNCGYFNGSTVSGAIFNRNANGTAPSIDLEALKAL